MQFYTSAMLEPSLDLYGETYETVDTLLDELITKSHARYAMIVDRQGFVLMHSRALWAPKPPSLDSLATLVASELFGQHGHRQPVRRERIQRNGAAGR